MPQLNDLLTPEQMNTAMADPKHLKQWLQATGRTWLVLPLDDLVDALPWPEGPVLLMQLLACWRDERRIQPTGETEVIKTDDGGAEVLVMKDEQLSVAELDRAIRYLIGRVTELDPKWSLEDAPR